MCCFECFHNNSNGTGPLSSHHETVRFLLEMFQQKDNPVCYRLSLDLPIDIVRSGSFRPRTTHGRDTPARREHD